ncbi:MAG: peptidylprolyl isomerase [Gemmatimonadota bacterium]|nr:peptidylprolyl isomerase [Gemmatimonadota bacterium]MDE2984885.1 peptidylprolyl isomerase [Gemmatimonadota bacterium]
MRRSETRPPPPRRSRQPATRRTLTTLLFLLPFGTSGLPLIAPVTSDSVRVVFETDLGSFELEIDVDRAPVTAANFLRYVDDGQYEGGSFYRTVHADNQPDDPIRIAVIQAGRNRDAAIPAFPPIDLERTSETGITHRDGTISMARAGPGTATHSFFICIGDQPSLDYGGMRNADGQGFAAFGRVVAGMEVVRAIHSAPYEGQRLTPAVGILRAYRRTGPTSQAGRA